MFRGQDRDTRQNNYVGFSIPLLPSALRAGIGKSYFQTSTPSVFIAEQNLHKAKPWNQFSLANPQIGICFHKRWNDSTSNAQMAEMSNCFRMLSYV
ncbi:hypothetical protein NPIL_437831 [Nephila pilipes]|uniref:Uncharacterized protein n=1 Tax=Nephila pilipes TaxID=299642 RepID=A0A8X6NZY6_NEPPI|nr:hypothetical protein NPIL_437831 [Nephila pilipes]